MRREIYKTLVLAITALLFLGHAAQAQKGRRGIVRKELLVRDPSALQIPEIKDFAFVVEILDDEKIRLSVQRTDRSHLLSAAELNQFFSGLPVARSKRTNGIEPIIIIEVAPSVHLASFLDLVGKIRDSSKLAIKIDCGGPFVGIHPKLNQRQLIEIMPNPLLLLVNVAENSTLSLNGKEAGSLTDPSKIERWLADIFRQREANGVFRPGTNEIEKTVYIKMSRSGRFSDLIKLADVLTDAGADRVGLQVDEPETVPERKELIPIGKKTTD